MNISFVDLRTQYTSLKLQRDPAIQGVLERTEFILGKEQVYCLNNGFTMIQFFKNLINPLCPDAGFGCRLLMNSSMGEISSGTLRALSSCG